MLLPCHTPAPCSLQLRPTVGAAGTDATELLHKLCRHVAINDGRLGQCRECRPISRVASGGQLQGGHFLLEIWHATGRHADHPPPALFTTAVGWATAQDCCQHVLHNILPLELEQALQQGHGRAGCVEASAGPAGHVSVVPVGDRSSCRSVRVEVPWSPAVAPTAALWSEVVDQVRYVSNWAKPCLRDGQRGLRHHCPIQAQSSHCMAHSKG